jgi:preprotein translocase subunit SecE
MARNNLSGVGGLEGRGSFLTAYKPGQGRYTRLGTVAAAGVVALAGANYLYDKLSVVRDLDLAWTLWIQAGVPVLAMALAALLVYWLVGRHRRVCDFMISTEGEMKKVSWSTRREVIGSTKVVITLVALLAVMLFVVDAAFAMFFNSIHVLKVFALKDLLG